MQSVVSESQILSTMKSFNYSLYTVLGVTLFFIPYAVLAQSQVTYTPLIGLPNLSSGSGRTLSEYVNAIYLACISIGAVFGVLRIAFAGVKYSLSDIVTDKASAKTDIKGVLLGLLILLTPAIILTTINPDLIKLEILSGSRVKLDPFTKQAPSIHGNTADRFARDDYNNNPANVPIKNDTWQLVGVKREVCNSLAVERKATQVFTPTGGNGTVGTCAIYPSI